MTTRDTATSTIALAIFFTVMAGFAVPDWSLVGEVARDVAGIFLVQVVVAIVAVAATFEWMGRRR